jgi:hypothetical protein
LFSNSSNRKLLFPFLRVDVTADPGLSAACFLSLNDAIADVGPPLCCSKEITSQNSKTFENKGMYCQLSPRFHIEQQKHVWDQIGLILGLGR